MDAADWNRRYAEHELMWSAEPNRFVAAELDRVAPGRALDLACGEGRNAIWLADRGWEVVAVDYSSVAIDRARKLAAERGVTVDWQVQDLLAWTPPPATFDLVLVAYLHLLWSEMRTALGRAAEAVAPGGLFLLVGHDRTNLEDGHGGPPNPAVLYTPDQVAGLLEGFEIDKADRLRRPVTTSDGVVEAIDNLVRAVRRCAV